MRRLGVSLAAIALSLAAIAPSAARAEEVTGLLVTRDRGGEITLDEALAMARKNHRGVAAARAKLAQAQTSLENAWSALFPTVGAQAKYGHNYKQVALPFGGASLLLQPSEQLDLGINFTMPVLAPAAYPALESVKDVVKVAEADYEISETNILVGVARAYLAAAVSDEVLVARHSAIDLAQATQKNAETRMAAGTVTKVDVDRAELAVVRAVQAEREASQGREQAYRALGTLIGAQMPFRIKPEIPSGPLPDARDLGTALKLRPEFRTFEYGIKAEDEARKAHLWRWAPTLSAFGNARKFNYDNFARDRYSWVVGGQLDWLLYDGGTRDASRHLSAAKVTEFEAGADLLKNTIRDSLLDGEGQLATKKSGVAAAERSVELAREALELVRVQYEAGTGTQLDLLQAQDAVVGAHLGLAQAHFDVAAADLALRHAAGTFPPK